MSTLAESFLADLDDLAEDEESAEEVLDDDGDTAMLTGVNGADVTTDAPFAKKLTRTERYNRVVTVPFSLS